MKTPLAALLVCLAASARASGFEEQLAQQAPARSYTAVCSENQALDAYPPHFKLEGMPRAAEPSLEIKFSFDKCFLEQLHVDGGGFVDSAVRVYKSDVGGYWLQVWTARGQQLSSVSIWQRFELAPGVPSVVMAADLGVISAHQLVSTTTHFGRITVKDGRSARPFVGKAWLKPADKPVEYP